mmetsp:Transcript_24180/g.57639  ORF Transcript_24180/g.57639 Transcript_24180/m.57639 type:complete len:272 (+) Transcript_24180:401-1216(+)
MCHRLPRVPRVWRHGGRYRLGGPVARQLLRAGHRRGVSFGLHARQHGDRVRGRGRDDPRGEPGVRVDARIRLRAAPQVHRAHALLAHHAARNADHAPGRLKTPVRGGQPRHARGAVLAAGRDHGLLLGRDELPLEEQQGALHRVLPPPPGAAELSQAFCTAPCSQRPPYHLPPMRRCRAPRATALSPARSATARGVRAVCPPSGSARGAPPALPCSRSRAVATARRQSRGGDAQGRDAGRPVSLSHLPPPSGLLLVIPNFLLPCLLACECA